MTRGHGRMQKVAAAMASSDDKFWIRNQTKLKASGTPTHIIDRMKTLFDYLRAHESPKIRKYATNMKGMVGMLRAARVFDSDKVDIEECKSVLSTTESPSLDDCAMLDKLLNAAIPRSTPSRAPVARNNIVSECEHMIGLVPLPSRYIQQVKLIVHTIVNDHVVIVQVGNHKNTLVAIICVAASVLFGTHTVVLDDALRLGATSKDTVVKRIKEFEASLGVATLVALSAVVAPTTNGMDTYSPHFRSNLNEMAMDYVWIMVQEEMGLELPLRGLLTDMSVAALEYNDRPMWVSSSVSKNIAMTQAATAISTACITLFGTASLAEKSSRIPRVGVTPCMNAVAMSKTANNIARDLWKSTLSKWMHVNLDISGAIKCYNGLVPPAHAVVAEGTQAAIDVIARKCKKKEEESNTWLRGADAACIALEIIDGIFIASVVDVIPIKIAKGSVSRASSVSNATHAGFHVWETARASVESAILMSIDNLSI